MLCMHMPTMQHCCSQQHLKGLPSLRSMCSQRQCDGKSGQCCWWRVLGVYECVHSVGWTLILPREILHMEVHCHTAQLCCA